MSSIEQEGGEEGTAILAFSDEKPAQILADYLKSLRIDARIVQRSPSAVLEHDESTKQENANVQTSEKLDYQIVVLNETDVPKALSIAKEFVASPNDPKYQQAAWSVGTAYASSSARANKKTQLPNWLQELKSTPFMSAVLLICIGIFALSFLGAFNAIYHGLTIRSFAELSQTHEWWRIVTPAFIHFSVFHIVFNLIWWWMLGSQLERIFGTLSLAIIFSIAAISSNVAQLLISGPNFGGLSGVVYALFGYVWWIGWLRPQWGIGLPNNLIFFLLGWLVLGYLDVLWVNMANEAHLFGLISGCLMALATHQLSGKQRPKA